MCAALRVAVVVTLVTIMGLCIGRAWADTAPLVAAPPAKTLTVGITPIAPFVMQDGSGYSGAAIELWQSLATELGLSYRYKLMPNLESLLQAASHGDVDIAIGNITITKDRLQRMDFTQPWFDTGLRIMVDQGRHQSVGGLFHQLWIAGHIQVFLWIAAIILIATFLLTLFDRHFDEEFPRAWPHGLAESLYHVMSVATSGKAPHKQMFGPFGRVFAAIWMLCGVGVVAYITSSITSVMTVSTITERINSMADLPGKTVGVVVGTVGEAYAIDALLPVRLYPDLPAAVKGMMDRQVAAIIGDASVLEYYDNQHPKLPITEVGAIFRPAKYGFATPHGSALTRLISVQIVADQENGYLSGLKARYFGVVP